MLNVYTYTFNEILTVIQPYQNLRRSARLYGRRMEPYQNLQGFTCSHDGTVQISVRF